MVIKFSKPSETSTFLSKYAEIGHAPVQLDENIFTVLHKSIF
jgi:hypothetical protein